MQPDEPPIPVEATGVSLVLDDGPQSTALVDVALKAYAECFDEVLDPAHRCAVADAVRAVLAALSSVGALMPAGGETREEFGHDTGNGSRIVPCDGYCRSLDPRHPNPPAHRRTVTTYPDGSTHTSAWEAIDG